MVGLGMKVIVRRQILRTSLLSLSWGGLEPEPTGVDDEGGQSQKDHRHYRMGEFTAREMETGGEDHDRRQADRSPSGQDWHDIRQGRQDQAERSSELGDADKGDEPACVSQGGGRRCELIEGEQLHRSRRDEDES